MIASRQAAPHRPATRIPVEVRAGRPALEEVLPHAEDLLDATGTPLSARPPWTTTWLRAFPSARPVTVVAGTGGRVDGLACLAVTRTGPVRTVTLAGDGPSDYGRLPARDPAAAAALAEGIAGYLAGLRGPWRLRLAQLPIDDPVAARLAELLPAARVGEGQGCPQLALAPERTLERHVSASSRRSARQSRDKVTRAGLTQEVEHVRDAARIRALLPELVELHRTRDHVLGRRSDLDDPRRRGFYAGVAARLATAGRADVFTLRLDGALAAYHLGFRDGSVFRSWSGRISSAWPSISLGGMLRLELIGGLIADPALDRIDWCRGALQHKMHAVTEVVPAIELTAESSPAVRDLLVRAARLRREVRRRMPDDLRRRLLGVG